VDWLVSCSRTRSVTASRTASERIPASKASADRRKKPTSSFKIARSSPRVNPAVDTAAHCTSDHWTVGTRPSTIDELVCLREVEIDAASAPGRDQAARLLAATARLLAATARLLAASVQFSVTAHS
jgi:hypothetical protein